MSLAWECGKFEFDLLEPVVMGILNVTPDSFSDGGSHPNLESAVSHASRMLEEGASIIDVGGESTRPGADPVSPEEELARVLPVVSRLCACGIAVSIDTRHAQVAKACLDAGACAINDVSGFKSEGMRELAAQGDAGLVIMHMQGSPKDMQEDPCYDDVVSDVIAEISRTARCLEAKGIARERICIDPGIGFGKRTEHNQKLVEATHRLAGLGHPVMAAVSRKSFIGAMTAIANPVERDEASALCTAFMVGQGAQVVRTHNVACTVEALRESRRAIIGMGSNMGDTAAHFDEALASMRGDSRIWVAAVSEYVTSKPAYLEEQPPFTNAIAVIQTTYEPHALLHFLQSLETAHGRVRTVANGPRPLDLDIVDYEGAVICDEELALPHPLALERDFVVTPILDTLGSYSLSDGTEVTRDNVAVGLIAQA